jgi:HrpA-like RNA helicase
MAEDEEVESALIPSLYKPPALLPIAQLKDQLLYTIETYPVTIVVGETGSGKLFEFTLNSILELTLPRQDHADTKIPP